MRTHSSQSRTGGCRRSLRLFQRLDLAPPRWPRSPLPTKAASVFLPAAAAVSLNVNVHADAELALALPNYTFATPIFGGQLQVGVITLGGRTSTALAGTITAGVGPFTATKGGGISDTTTGVGDLIPLASLRWNNGVNNFMTYVTGDIPVGDYSSTQLANLGIGHGAIDSGVSYTYLNPKLGQELSVTTGLTYNMVNQSTGYQNGID